MAKINNKILEQGVKLDKFKCPECGKGFQDRSGLYHHSQLHSDDRPFVCGICQQAFKTNKYLCRHVSNVHKSNGKRFTCDECGRKFKYKSGLDQHMAVHMDEKPHKCKVCNKGFNSTYSLTVHIRIHTNSKPYKCSYCEYACRDNSTLRKHEARHRGEVQTYQCKFCDRSFSKKPILKLHVFEAHMKVDTRQTPCQTCGKMFRSDSHLRVHNRHVHSRIYAITCDICGVQISNKYNMMSHLRTHVDARPHRCTHSGCNKAFKDKSTLKKHIVIHYPETQHACQVCGRRFARRPRLASHLLQHQPRERCVACDYCGASFFNKNYLAKHIRKKHLERETFRCDACEFVTGNKPSLVMHIKYGHEAEKDKQCKICSKTYKKHIYLKAHYWKSHFIRYKVNNTMKRNKPANVKKKCDLNALEVSVIKEEVVSEEEGDEFSRRVMKERLDRALESADTSAAPGDELGRIVKQVFTRVVTARKIPEAVADQRIETRAKRSIDRLLEKTRKKVARRDIERDRRGYNRRMELVTARSEKPLNSLANVKFPINNDVANKSKNSTIIGSEYQIILNKNIYDMKEENDTKSGNEESECDDYVKHSEDIQEEFDRNINDTDNIKNEINAIDNNQNSPIDEVQEERENWDNTSEHNNSENDERICGNVNISTGNTDANGESDTESYNYEDKDYNEYHKAHTESKSSRKLLSNIHQCYVCFKLYKTKDELLDHCKEHFDVCNITMLRKCPLCDHVSNINMRRHIKTKHNINIKLHSGHIRDRKDNKEGSRFYYDINNKKFDKMEIIPSVKNLNRQAYVNLDKQRREFNNTTVQKKKLVKKGNEWVVLKEKVRINDYVLPKLDCNESKTKPTDDYCERLKSLSQAAKKNGHKMMYPCGSCEKICQTLAALKLHCRKHDPNAKPFKPKVWKHKLKLLEGKKTKKTKRGNKDEEPNEIDDNIEPKNENRFLDPKPIVNKHKCDPELKKFYENNIKGGDIEFWQFLKIYNKMTREKIENFADLENRTDFGCHVNNEETKVKHESDVHKDMETLEEKPSKRTVQRMRNVKYRRKIMLSKREYEKRNEIKRRMREQIQKMQ